MFEFLEENWILLALLVIAYELIGRRVVITPAKGVTVTNSTLTNGSTGGSLPVLQPGSGVKLSPASGGTVRSNQQKRFVNELYAHPSQVIGDDGDDDSWGDED